MYIYLKADMNLNWTTLYSALLWVFLAQVGITSTIIVGST